MPIEIKELHIKVNVEEDSATPSMLTNAEASEQNEDQLIAKCVKEVLRILKDKNEP